MDTGHGLAQSHNTMTALAVNLETVGTADCSVMCDRREILLRWRKIGQDIGLTSDLQIAGFLIEKYESRKPEVQSATHCKRCYGPLTLCCVTCQQLSQEDHLYPDSTKTPVQHISHTPCVLQPLTDNDTPLTDNNTPLTDNNTPLTDNNTPLDDNSTSTTTPADNHVTPSKNYASQLDNHVSLAENPTSMLDNHASLSGSPVSFHITEDMKRERDATEQGSTTWTRAVARDLQVDVHSSQVLTTSTSDSKFSLTQSPFCLEPDSDLDLQNIQISFGDISGLDVEENSDARDLQEMTDSLISQTQQSADFSVSQTQQLAHFSDSQTQHASSPSTNERKTSECPHIPDSCVQGESPAVSKSHDAVGVRRKSPRVQQSRPDEAVEMRSEVKVKVQENTRRSSRRQGQTTVEKSGAENKGKDGGKMSRISRQSGKKAGAKPYICKDCGASFNWRVVLTRHMRTHTGEKPFVCTECGSSFSWKGALTVHMRVHTGERPFVCDECGYAFRDRGDLKKHVRIHTGERPYVCKDCGFAFYQCGALKKHILRKHTAAVDKSFICDVCGSAFSEIGKLKAHRLRHTGYRPFLCKDCGFAFTHASHLKRHVQAKHLGEKPYVCVHCGAAFTQNSALKMHTVTHTGVKPFLCEKCGMSFTQRSHWVQHSKQQACCRSYSCNDCGQTFSLKKNLLKHMRSHRTQEGPFECSECGATFGNKGSLKQHTQTHRGSGRFVCQDCGAVFIQSRSLKKHVRLKHADADDRPSHPNDGSAVAEVDGSAVAEMGKILQAQSADKPFVCTHCGAAFAQARYLKRHEKRKHTADKKFVCVECKAGFIGKSPLIAHMRIHTGDQPFVCKQCGVTFTHYGQLKRHLKRTHEEMTEHAVAQPFLDMS